MADGVFETESPWGGRIKTAFWVLLIAATLAVVFLFFRNDTLVLRNSRAYHAVFLDNGQVYFGKLASVNRDLWGLSDIYYLRAGTVQNFGQEGGQQVDLIKLGAELHGPKDEMIINKERVIFYEEIREDGEVARLIREHKSRQGDSTAP